MIRNASKLGQISFLAVLAAGLSAPVFAQQDDGANSIEEVIVTARKREENLRDVPVAVSAFSEATMAEASISDVQDLALISPGLSYREGFGRATGNANNRPSIRGMSSILGAPNASFFVDGIYVNGPITAYSMENLERAEVIRGPQAATFGRGTFAGAVNFVTRRPGDEFNGRIKVEAGDHDTTEINGFISGPLIEGALAYELNARHYDRGADPKYPNQATNGGKIGAEQTTAVGVKLNWTPTDTASIYLNLQYSEDEDGTFAYGLWNGGDNGPNDINSNSANTSNCFGPTFLFSIFTANRSRGYWCGEIGTPKAFYEDLGGLNGVERETLTANVIADFELGNWLLTSATGYTTYDYQNAFAAIYSGASVSWSGRDGNKTLSQEIRLSTNTDSAARFTVGGYFYRQESGDGFSTSFNPLNTNPGDIDLAAAAFSDDSEVQNVAVFAGVDWDLDDRLTLSAEVRHQKEDLKLGGTNAAGNLTFAGSPSIDFSATLPKVALSFAATDTVNLYAAIATGNSPGGFNENYYETRFVQAERDIFVATRGTYEESDVTSYEVGMKGLYYDGAVALNVSLYQNDWEKQALTNSDALTQVASGTQTTVAYITNAGKSSVTGAEIELIARPTDYLDFSLNYAWANGEFDDYLDENFRDLLDTNGIYTGLDVNGDLIVDTVDPDGQVKGNALPQTPEHMISLSTNLHWPMGADGEGYFRIDYSHESKRYVQAANLAWIGASENVNARLGWRNDNWEVSLWAKNLTDDDTPEVVTRLLDFRQFLLMPSQVRASGLRFSFIRDFTVTAPRSREVGATLTYRF